MAFSGFLRFFSLRRGSFVPGQLQRNRHSENTTVPHLTRIQVPAGTLRFLGSWVDMLRSHPEDGPPKRARTHSLTPPVPTM